MSKSIELVAILAVNCVALESVSNLVCIYNVVLLNFAGIELFCIGLQKY